MINTMEECLQTLGCKKPFKKFVSDKNISADMFTEEGYKAYNKLREILSFLSDVNLISEFNEDSLDRFVDINY